MKTICIIFLAALMVASPLFGQEGGNLRGHVLDKDTELGIEGAKVELLNFSPPRIVQTDEAGFFSILGVGVGRYRVKVMKDGYATQIFSDLLVGANEGEATEMSLAALTAQEQEEIVKQKQQSVTKTEILYVKTAKDVPFNQMVGAAVRPFTVEEVTRYAGARFDMARLTNNFAGVSNNYDARNDIVIRGNSPAYLTWQIEELPMISPNHITSLGTAGGTTSAINIFAVGRADFMKGSFAAQYGNSLAGVFDVQLRSGNSKDFSFMAQIGTQRAEFVAEGPMGHGKKSGSFMVSVRQSLGTYLYEGLTYPMRIGSPAYQRILDWADPMHRDLNFKLHFAKLHKQEVELFGILGHSRLFIPHWRGALRDKIRYQIFEGESFLSESVVGLVGLKHTWRPNANLLWRTVVGASIHNSRQDWEAHSPNSTTMSLDVAPSYLSTERRRNYMLHSYIQYKPSASFMLRAGLLSNLNDFDLYAYYTYDNLEDLDYKGQFLLQRAYAQTKWQPLRRFTVFAGVHAQYYSLSGEAVAEPRLALQYDASDRHSFALAGGLYHQTQHHDAQFQQAFTDSLGNLFYDNTSTQLGFMRSWQADAEYRWFINENWRLKAQAYLQLLDHVAIDKQNASPYSMMNTGESFFDFYSPLLTTTGKGHNMGLELTIEKYFSKNFYLLATGTIYDSRALGSDGIWRNTVFNNKYIFNVLFGREFTFGKLNQNVFFVDWRFCTRGGRPYTPIDPAATYQQGFQNGGLEEVFIDSLTNRVRTPAFYQVDFKMGLKFNDISRKVSHSVRLDLFNIFDIKNVLTYRYNAVFDPASGQSQQGQVVPIYQRGFIPDLTYTVQF